MDKKSIIDTAHYYIDKTMSKFADPDGFTDSLTESEKDYFWEVYSKIMEALGTTVDSLKKEVDK